MGTWVTVIQPKGCGLEISPQTQTFWNKGRNQYGKKTKVEQVPTKHIALFSAEISFSPVMETQLRQYLTKYYFCVMRNMVILHLESYKLQTNRTTVPSLIIREETEYIKNVNHILLSFLMGFVQTAWTIAKYYSGNFQAFCYYHDYLSEVYWTFIVLL